MNLIRSNTQKGVSIDESCLGASASGSAVAEEVATAQEVKSQPAAVQAEAPSGYKYVLVH